MSYGTVWGIHYMQAAFSSTFTYPFTVVAWIKKDATQWAAGGADYVFCLGQDFTADDDYIRAFTTADNFAGTRVWSGSTSSAQEAFTDGTFDDIWVPVVQVVEAEDDGRVYVENFSREGTDINSRPLSALDSFRVGRLMTSFGGFEGLIGDMAVFDKALVESEIDAIQSAPETGPPLSTIAPSNCLAYWSTVDSAASYADLGDNGGPTLVKNGTSPAYDSDHHIIIEITSVSTDDVIGAAETDWAIAGSGFGAD